MGTLYALVDLVGGLRHLVLNAVDVGDDLLVGLRAVLADALPGLCDGLLDMLAAVRVLFHRLLHLCGDAVNGGFRNVGKGAQQRFRHVVIGLCDLCDRAVDFGLDLLKGRGNTVHHLLAGRGGGLGDAVFDFARAVLDLFGKGLDAGGHSAQRILRGGGSCAGDGRNDRFGGGLGAGGSGFFASGRARRAGCNGAASVATGCCRFRLTLRPALVADANAI